MSKVTKKLEDMNGAETVKAAHDNARKQSLIKLKQSTPILVVKGLWLFAEGAALLITSLYAIFQGYKGDLPQWGGYILLVSGALVLVPASLLLGKFFRAIGKE